MKITRNTIEENYWKNNLQNNYKSNDRTGTHVSDLILCLRQSVLARTNQPKWEDQTLFRFTMGRSLETTFWRDIIQEEYSHFTQELEVEKDGVVGHIDFGGEFYDYECKLTWGREPKDEYLEKDFKEYWLDQAGAYTYMRGRTSMRFIVGYINPVPRLRCYQVTWTEEELQDLWDSLIRKKLYVEKKTSLGQLPMRTVETWLCKGCPYNEVCYATEE